MSRATIPARTAVIALAAVLALLASMVAGLVVAPAGAAVDEEGVAVIEDFEGADPVTVSGPVGIYPWNYEGESPELSVAELAGGNHVLRGDYTAVGGRGFIHDLEQPDDWSAFAGIRFRWDSAGAGSSPTAPPAFAIELRLGGDSGANAGLWTTTVTPPSGGGLQPVSIPFSSFVWRGDYQPPGAVQTEEPPLDHAWGYAITLPVGASGSFYMDDVELYGAAQVGTGVDVSATPVVAVDGGEVADVVLTVTTPDGEPLADDVTLTYSTGGGTAVAGTHYEAVTEEVVTFAAGTASGATRTVSVTTLAPAAEEDVARTIAGTLEVDGAELEGDAPVVVVNAYGMAYLDAALSAQERAADLLARMDLAEKVGQMAQGERASLAGDPAQVAELRLGSILSGGGSTPTPNTPEAWADMVDGFQLWTRLTPHQIPLIYGVDAVHGHNNLPQATIFPHNIGLGASRDPVLARLAAEVTATETRATGVPWTFAPCLCVTRDERWGRSYESFGEDPGLVSAFTTVVEGLQGTDEDMSAPDEVLATIKHWVGDGGTSYVDTPGDAYKIDQGVTEVTEDELREVHIAPYVPAIARGAGSLMPSYSSVDLTDDDEGPVKMHGHDYLNNEVLRGELGFDGFTISDYNGIDQLPGSYPEQVRAAVNASVDMAMEPADFAAFITTLTDEVGSGGVTQARVDEAVTRILVAKFRLGLFDEPWADRTNVDAVGSAGHRAVAREAAAASQVLLANEGGLLPLDPAASLYVAGSNADDVGNQSGGWTVSWQGMSGDVLAGATSILEGIREVAPDAAVTFSEDATAPMAGHDVGVVVVGETPYAEGQGDVGVGGHDLELSAGDRAAADAVCAAMDCVVLVVSGRPQVVTDLVGVDALVASWLPGSEGAGVADVLFGARPFTGRLPVSWPAAAADVPVNVGDEDYAPLYGFGWGLRTDAAQDRLVDLLDRVPAGHPARAALEVLAESPVWSEEGRVDEPERALDLLLTAAQYLAVAPQDTTAGADVDRAIADVVVSLPRDLAQAAMVAGDDVPEDAVAVAADAEHELHAGDPEAAVVLLASILGLSPTALELPGAPTDVVAVAGDGRATTTWSAPEDDGGSALVGYLVTAWVDGVAQSSTGADAAATEATVTGLRNGTTYTFTVAAVNALGVGADSAPSNAVTPQGATPTPTDPTPTDPTPTPTDPGTTPPGGTPPGGTPPGGTPPGDGALPDTGAAVTGLALLATVMLGAGALALVRRRALAG
ncbi:glycoside hydrolase family 3 N-terminal domain-containing protein [Georgenia sp. MJ206]|uniref:glycoside hydrolase family 3 N-terminal domain-containing protein n=1 Tax=Georgenia wangjunii TaxID=3117730 RepID=UPI002F26B13A